MIPLLLVFRQRGWLEQCLMVATYHLHMFTLRTSRLTFHANPLAYFCRVHDPSSPAVRRGTVHDTTECRLHLHPAQRALLTVNTLGV